MKFAGKEKITEKREHDYAQCHNLNKKIKKLKTS